MAIIGSLGIYWHPWVSYRYQVVFLAISVVGVGSLAFHATLTKLAQALDEVPMLYTIFAFLYVIFCNRLKLKKSTRNVLAVILIVYSVIATYLITAFEGTWQFVSFQIIFGSAEFLAFYQMFLMYFAEKSKNPESEALNIFQRSVVLFIAAITSWSVDLVACDYINPNRSSILPINPQLHAWWHILMSLGVYHMVIFNIVLQEKVGKVYYRMKIFPVVSK
jgi:dihydroceramidase